MRAAYTLLFYLALPVILLRLLWRSLKAPAYARRWGERFGFVPRLDASQPVVWLHTVSVGEFLAALPLIRQLQDEVLQLVITTTTPTGSERVKAALGDSVYHVYAPYDLPDCLARFLGRVRPQLMLMMETELWPNTIAACKARGIATALINGRLSARSARGYARLGGVSRGMLESLSVAAIQHRDDAARFLSLGLPPERVQITGNIKFDLQLSAHQREQAAALQQAWRGERGRPVWIAASTHQGEDEQILDALAILRAADSEAARQLLLVLVPRHPERFASVAALCEKRGFVTVRRSSGSAPGQADILLGDTMGELLLMLGASDMAFVGGSLVPNGGHNLMEPAAWQLPLQSGPHVFNFAEASRQLHQAGALVFCEDAAALAADVHRLLTQPEVVRLRGEAALEVVEANRGALQKTVQLIRPLVQR